MTADADAATPYLEPSEHLLKITHLIYGLQAAVYVTGGVTYVAAVIINYIKKDEVRGTWLAPHFRWQIRTFWYSMLWSAFGGLTAWLLFGYVVLFITWVWVLYRIVRGWVRLGDRRPMYPNETI